MLSCEQHLDNLIRHIDMVRQAGVLMGKRLMERGEKDFGRLLIAKCYEHDVTKFYGIEWKYLHAGNDVPKAELERAVQQHVATNPHHPEYWGGLEYMPRIAVAEMVCDWLARSQEFGTGLRDWITEVACERFDIDTESEQYVWIMSFVDIVLEDAFVRSNEDVAF